MGDAPLTLGTAGHIDHGKTALVRALTGKDTDRLPEEHRRGISIELGYARLDLPSGRSLSVVDVPGHERFVRTMVAGATGVDLYLLCVAADDGVMPQTREHAAVLRRLGVAGGVVAITKSDVADPALVAGDVAELAPEAEVVAVSAVAGTGLDELLAALDRVAATTPSRAAADGAPARLHVDRSFTLKGIGTVVTGTLWSGTLAIGDQVQILPAGKRARVRSVQVHDEQVERAAAGQRVALNLVGVDRREVARGDVVVTGGGAVAAHIVDVLLELEPDVAPLEAGARVQVHHGTRESPARAYPRDEGVTQLRLDVPLIAERGDRLILRRIAPPDTIGGATVVDPAARRSRRAEQSHDERPAVPAPEPPQLDDDALRLGELLRGDGAEPRTDVELAVAAGIDGAAAARAFAALEANGRATRVARNLHFDPGVLSELTERVAAVCERDGSVTIGGLRDELGTSRKYAQALLEHLDAAKVTLRRGDEHVLRRRQGA